MAFNYIKSTQGIIKIVEEVLNFLAFVLVISHSKPDTKGEAFLAAAIGAFIITGIILILNLFEIREKIQIPWTKIEIVYCIVWSIFYLVVAALIIDYKQANKLYVAGGSFGLFAVITYLLDAYDNYQRW